MNRSGGTKPAGGCATRRPPAGVPNVSGLRSGSTPGFQAGVSVLELTIVLALVAATAAISAPVFASSIDSGRGRQAAQYLASECRNARMEAVARSAASAIVFDQIAGQWRIRRCRDGNGNGVRRADITSGRDACMSGSASLGEMFSGVSIVVDPALPDPDGGAGSSDPVRLGTANLASFTPTGTATGGTVYVRSAGGAQFAIRIAGATGRTRVLRYETVSHSWTEV